MSSPAAFVDRRALAACRLAGVPSETKRATSRATGLVQQSTTLTLLNLALVVASMFVVHSAPSQQIATPAGFTALFNGTDFSGWRGGDTFDHRAWLAMPEAERSNVFIREIPADEANGSGDPAYVGMCKIPVLDDSSERFRNNDPRQANGSAYGMVAGQRGYLRAPGQWNFEQITIKGSTILVELNGTTILDADLAEVTDFLANHPHPGKERTLATSELPAIVIQFSSGPSASSNCPDGPERSRRSGDAYRLEAISQRISISLKLGLGILGWKTCDSVGVLCCLWRIHARFPRTDRAG